MLKFKSKNQKQQLISFSKWTNKKYAVFNSLKRLIKISTLSVAYTIVVLPVKTNAQTDTVEVSKTLDLEEVVVSAERSPVIYSKLARIVTIIDDSSAHRLPVQSVNELIESNSFVDVRQRGTNGVQADISIRGGTFDQNLILLNGINVSDPQTGHHSLNLPVDLQSVQRIEILEGSGSRVFGPNAFSGAINIITNKPENNYVRTSFTAGDFGLFTGSLGIAYNFKNLGQFIAVSKSISGGYTYNTDFNNLSVFYNPYLNSKWGKIDFQIGYTNRSFGAKSFYTPEYPDQYEQIKTTFTSIKFETGGKVKLIPAVYYRQHKDRFELFRINPASWYAGHNYHLTRVYGAKIDTRISWNMGSTSLGAEYRSENILSNKLGLPLNDTIKIYDEPDGYYDKEYGREATSIFVEHSFSSSLFSVTAGVLGSYLMDNTNRFNIYPGIDMGLNVSPNHKLFASINKSLRLPTFTDLFYNGPKNIGNPDLYPEEAWSYEGGFRYNNKFNKSSVSIFYRDSKNLIEWVRHKDSLETTKWETQNLTAVGVFGLQFSYSLDVRKVWNNQPIQTISLYYSFINQQIQSNEYNTKYSLNYLKHNMNLTVMHSVFRKIDFAWNIKYQDRTGAYQPYDLESRVYKAETEFKPVILLDAKMSWNIKYLKIFAAASNIFNVNYADFSNINMPGRWFSAGIEFNYAWDKY